MLRSTLALALTSLGCTAQLLTSTEPLAHVELVADRSHSCAVSEDGRVRCWGLRSELDELMDGLRELGPIRRLALGSRSGCAESTAGAIQCWGPGVVSRVRTLDTHTTDLAVDIDQACAVADGRVHCWTVSGSRYRSFSSLGEAAQIDIGREGRACARMVDGGVACWFEDSEPTPLEHAGGAVDLAVSNGVWVVGGDGRVAEFDARGRLVGWVAGLCDAVDVEVGQTHACARRRSGRVGCWRAGERVVPVAGVSAAVELSVGGDHACVYTSDGNHLCWAVDDAGQVAETMGLRSSDRPRRVFGLPPASNLRVGSQHVCATTTTDELWCWGHRQGFERGANEGHRSPMAIANHVELLELGNEQTYVKRRRGRIVNLGTKVRDPLLAAFASEPPAFYADVPVFDINPAWACYGVDDGVECISWAAHPFSLINERQPWRPPARVQQVTLAGSPVRSIAVGQAHICAVTDDGLTRCWGRNDYGQVAAGPLDRRTSWLEPRVIEELPPSVLVVAGMNTSCALAEDGQPWCWGSKFSVVSGRRWALGPAEISGLPALVSLTAGRDHVCGVDAHGRVWCWGSNHEGQLGARGQPDGPIEVVGLSAVTVDAEGDTTCALDRGGAVWCWGANDDAQLGTADSLWPRRATVVTADRFVEVLRG